MKKFSNTLFLVFLGLFSCFLFIYLSFPYAILKEAASVKFSEAVKGHSLQIGELRPKLPVGFSASNVSLRSNNGNHFSINELNGGIQVLSLLFGKLGLEVDLEDSKKGTLEASSKFSIPQLIMGNAVPSSIYIQSKNFEMSHIVNFIMNSIRDTSKNILVQQILDKFSFKGNLNADINLDLDPSGSAGKIYLGFSNAILVVLDEVLQLPDLKFEKAKISAVIKGETLTIIEKESGFKVVDKGVTLIEISFSGRIDQKYPIDQSKCNIEISFLIGGVIKEQFGIFLNAPADEKEVRRTLKLSGKITDPVSSQN